MGRTVDTKKRQKPRQARRGANTANSNKQQERRRASEVVRNRGHKGSRGDGSELLFGNTVVLGGLDGGPGRGRWSVAVKTFDELLRRVAWSTRGFQNDRDQVHTGVPVKLFLFFSFGRVALVGAGGRNEPSIGRERRDNRRVM